MAKRTFVVALWLGAERVLKAEFENNAGGFKRLWSWVKAHGVGAPGLRAALESTSTYGEALLEWLYAKHCAVFLLNPEQVAHYGRARGQRNHTDRADAVTIAAFIAHHEATPWQPLPPERKDLRSLTRTRAQIVGIAQTLSQQLQTATGPAVAHLKKLLAAARQQLAEIGRAIAAHLRAQPKLQAAVRRLMTCKGVGLVTAAVVVAELPPVTKDTDPRTIAAWAGLTPRRWQSGPREWTTRLSRKGNVHLRQALYMPALVARRYNPLLRAFAQRLAERGKSSGAILGAVAHKMLRILVALLRSESDFNPNWSAQNA